MRLQDVCDLIVDCPHSTVKDEGKGYPLIRTPNVGRGRLILDGVHRVSFAAYCTRNERATPQTNDLILAREAPVGNVAIIKEGQQVCLGQRTVLIRPNRNIADSEYLVHYLLSPKMQYVLLNSANGATVSHLNMSDIRKLEIVLPDLETQKKVGGILSAIEDKIEVNKYINDNLTEQARSIFHSWFIDYEPFGGSVPSDWQPSTLGQIATINTDSWSPAKNPDVVVEHYSIPAFDEQHYPVFEIASGIKSNKYILTSDSVMISKLNPDTKRIWRPMCLSEHPVCSTEFIVYEARKNRQRDYVYSIIDSVPFLNHLCSHTTGSTNSRQRATPKATLEFPVFLLPDSVAEEFCSIVTPMYDLIASNIIENQSLAQIRDNLLPRLMSGELDVSSLDL